jgi:hypothetical protein
MVGPSHPHQAMRLGYRMMGLDVHNPGLSLSMRYRGKNHLMGPTACNRHSYSGNAATMSFALRWMRSIARATSRT